MDQIPLSCFYDAAIKTINECDKQKMAPTPSLEKYCWLIPLPELPVVQQKSNKQTNKQKQQQHKQH